VVAPACASLDECQIETYRRIPDGQDRHAFVCLCSAAIRGYRISDDLAVKALKAHALLDVVKRHCRVLLGSASTRLRNRHRSLQLTGRTLEQTATVTAVEPGSTTKELQDARATASARKHAAHGHLGRAARALAREEGPEWTETHTRKLADLHPVGEDPIVTQPRPIFAVHFEVEHIKQVLQQCSNGAAPGPTGWTEELLLDAMADEHAAAEIAALITDIANAHVDANLRDRLIKSKLIGLPKPDGGVRPIAMGEVLLKAATRLAMDACKDDIARLFNGVQYGVLCRSGCERIIHTCRNYLRAPPSPTPVMVTLDFRNAFNTPSREAMARAATALPAMAGIFFVEYGKAAPLLFRKKNGEIEQMWSRRGSRQGSAGGPLFFCLVLQHALNEACRVPGVRVMAYMDDVTILAPNPRLADEAVAIIHRLADSWGLALNAKKCHWLSSVAPGSPLTSSFARDSGASLLLGAAVGTDDAAERTLLHNHTARAHDRFFARLRQMQDPCGAAILAVCGVPKVNHVIRTHEPAVSLATAERFDQTVEDTWQAWSGAEVTDAVRRVAHLPRKLCGLGFTRSVSIAGFAYAASFNSSMDMTGPHDQKALVAEFNRRTLAELQQTDPAYAQLANVASAPGGSAWLWNPSTRVSRQDFAAALRMRMLASLPGTPERMQCPGCRLEMSRTDWIGHVVGCARLRDVNASARHQDLKRSLLDLMCKNRVDCDPHEPREYLCEGCRKISDDYGEHMTHRQLCAHVPPDAKGTPGPSQGPDIRCEHLLPDMLLAAAAPVGADGAHIEASHMLIDVTVVAACAPSMHGKTVAALFDDVAKRKVARYGDMAARRKEPLYVASMTHLGHMSTATTQLIRAVCARGGTDPAEAWAALSAKACFTSAAVLRNAEQRNGMYYRVAAPSPVLHVAHARIPDAALKGVASTPTSDAAPAVPPRAMADLERHAIAAAVQLTHDAAPRGEPQSTPHPSTPSAALQTPQRTPLMSDAAVSSVERSLGQ
jgi:hypothetical protein